MNSRKHLSIGFSKIFSPLGLFTTMLHNFTFTYETKSLRSPISIQKLQPWCWCFTFQRKTTTGVVLSQRGSHHPGYWPRQRSHTLQHFCDSLPLLSVEGTVFPAGFSLWESKLRGCSPTVRVSLSPGCHSQAAVSRDSHRPSEELDVTKKEEKCSF